MKSIKQITFIGILCCVSPDIMAQNSAFIEEVVVTATKKKNVENVQEVAASINAFGSTQLEVLKVKDISDLSYKTPNVSLEDIGTAKGTANFTIRGLGVNSSIPSIDPAVGVFVDGIYYGINAGVIFDTFDLSSVEILKGPQGVLFGRNVTGGAVVLNTTNPSFDKSAKFKLAAESGLRGTGANYYAQGTLTGTLVEDTLAGKIGVYYNDDEGWFENTLQDGSKEDFGENDTIIIRPALLWTPNENTEVIIKYEYGEFDGDGPAAQSHTNGLGIPGQIRNFDRDSFDFSVSDNTFLESKWHNLSAKANFDVAFGDGRITNIFGYRDYSSLGLSDIDSTSSRIFDAEIGVEQDQISNELRYNGTFGKWDITTGLFYFQQDLLYSETRFILQDFFASIGRPTSIRPGGGVLDQRTVGIFAQAEYALNEKLTLIAGLRYSDERKDVRIASVLPGVQRDTNCRVTRRNCIFDFNETTNPGQTNFETDNLSPKLGFKYAFKDNHRIYGHWTRSFRAGGFNFRNTAVDKVNLGPGPFQDEEVDSFEFGWKSEPWENTKLNIAIFRTEIDGLQREINRADPIAGVVQIIRNSANAKIDGIEADMQIAMNNGLVLSGSIGYLSSDYEDIFFDISGDGVINDADRNLKIPRLADLTYNLSAYYETEIGSAGVGSMLLNFSHRDEAAYTDNNLGTLNENDRLDLTLAYTMQNDITFSLYGKNLTNEVSHGNDTQLPSRLGPAPVGGTFAPLNKGRVYGIEVKTSF